MAEIGALLACQSTYNEDNSHNIVLSLQQTCSGHIARAQFAEIRGEHYRCCDRMTISAVQKALFTSCSLLTDIINMGRAVAVGAAESLDL